MTRQEIIDDFLVTKRAFDQDFFRYGDPRRAMRMMFDRSNPMIRSWWKHRFTTKHDNSRCSYYLSYDKVMAYYHELSRTNANGELINCVEHEEQWNFGIEDSLLEELLNKL